MQVAGHVLWPRLAWLYYGAIFLMTLSILLSGGIFYDIKVCQTFLWRME